MNEPKRRGRPPKAALLEPKVEGADAVQDVVVVPKTHYSAIEAPMRFATESRTLAQAYALRLWNNQSPDLSRHERLGRIADALKAQGMSMEGVELP